jgi:iron complex transport system substrate-binding protein
MKMITAVGALLIGSTILAACGQSKAADSGAGAAQQSTASRVVATGMGEVTVPSEPKKIAVLVGTYADHLLTLGVKPHAIDSGEGNSYEGKEYIKEQLKDSIPLGSTFTPNLESILAAQPDLILSNKGAHEKAYKDMSLIAPTILFENPDADWRRTLIQVGEAVGKKELAQKKVEEYEAKAASAKAKLQASVGEQKILFLRVLPKEIRVYGVPSRFGKLLYEDLGLRPAANIPTNKDQEAVSMEKLPEINPDIIFLMNSSDNIEDFKENPLWKNLKAVKNGKIYAAEKDVWPWGGWLANNQAIDYLLKILADKK